MENYPFGLGVADLNNMTFLIISDIHLNHKKLEKLKNWYFSSFSQKLDFLLILGDFDNIPQSNLEVDKEICAKSEANISNILSFLEFVACPIFYLPGNHDAFTLFLKDPAINPLEHKKLTQNSTNLHLSNFLITKDLQFVGVGGSIPAFRKQDQGLFQIYEGFPYKKDEEFEMDLQKIKGFFSDKVQTILLTHNGPEFSSTSLNLVDQPNNPIYFGSMSLFKLLAQQNNNILLNCHGHIHDGTGKVKIGTVDILNPGSLGHGNFCILELAKNNVENKWIVKSTNFLNLNAFN